MKKRKGMIPTPPVVNPAAENLEQLGKLKRKLAAVPKPKKPRPKVGAQIGLEIALRQGIMCGCGCGRLAKHGEAHMEHDPALENREYDPVLKRYTPRASDPNFLAWWRNDCHDKKTHGPGGAKRITTKGSDNHQREHRENLSASEAKHHEKMAKAGKPVVPRRI